MMEEYTREKIKLSELGSFRKKIFEKIYEENKPQIIAKVKDEYNLYDDKLAADIFEAGGEVSTNGPGDDEEEQERYTKSRYLLLSLPLPIEKLGKKVAKALKGEKDEEKKRQREYETFVRDHVNEDLTIDDIEVVKSKESMLDCISQFLKKKETAFENVIVFNGHGADDDSPGGGGRGLCFAEEEQNMPLDDVIKEIITIRGELKLGMVCIIFAQCWAHLHSPTEDVTVIYFTSKNKPKTRSFPGINMDLSKYTSVLRQVTPREYLLLSAPEPEKFSEFFIYQRRKRTILDKDMRQKQFESFIARLDDEIRPNPPPEPVVVTNWGLMLAAIRRFLAEGNSQKVIIFNGYGDRKGGLLLAERGWDDPLDLNYVISEVAKEVKKITQQVQLIFAQDHGHLYTEDAMGGIENFQVIPLTDERVPVTFALINNQRGICKHAQLEEYAIQLNDTNKQNATSANSEKFCSNHHHRNM